jgi:hypothetical protein
MVPSIWFLQTIAGALAIAAFTFVGPGDLTPCFILSWTSARGF